MMGEPKHTLALVRQAAEHGIEERFGVTWGLDGYEMKPRQIANELGKAGFRDYELLADATATMFAEAGGFLMAWHLNVEHDLDGQIRLDEHGQMNVLSIDLGFTQENEPVHEQITPDEASARDLVSQMFSVYEWGKPGPSAREAHRKYVAANYRLSPWVAFTSGAYWQYRGNATVAVANAVADFHYRLGQGYVEAKP